MKDVVLQVKNGEGMSKEELSKTFDQEIEDFSKFLSDQVKDWKSGGPLHVAERMLIKTYLVQKFTGKIDNGSSAGSPDQVRQVSEGGAGSGKPPGI